MSNYTFSIWWIKRDFRLKDNLALSKALENSKFVLPLFTFEPSITNSPDYSNFHKKACITALKNLREKLIYINSNIWIDEHEIEEVLQKINKKKQINAIFSHEETGTNFTYKRDKRIKKWLLKHDTYWHEFPTNGVVRRLKNRAERSKIWNKRAGEPIINTPFAIPLTLALKEKCNVLWNKNSILSKKLIGLANLDLVSEDEAQNKLNSFLITRGKSYSGGISSPNTAFTSSSRLSAQIAWGTITLKQIIFALNKKKLELRADNSFEAKQWRRSLNAFSSRLHWHDHFIQRLESEPRMEFSPLNPAFRDLPYKYSEKKLTCWIKGKTGVPMVDACMRCLNTTGFLNFRMRAMVVSYACHVLHLSWKDIMYPLAKLFLDYEPGIHISQLQMQAGVVGINTVRVYSPDKQMKDQDPNLLFVRKWVPELAKYSNNEIFNYLDLQFEDYPRPIVDYKIESAKMKKAIYAIKRSKEGKTESSKVLNVHGSRKNRRKKKKSPYTQLSLFKENEK